MNEAVQNLAEDSGYLLRVAGRGSIAARYDVLEFTFSNGILRLSCLGDTDEIAVDVVDEASGDVAEIRDDAFVDITGMIIELAWTMVNDRGYEDAFQFRCLDLQTRYEVCLQFEVAASSISVSRFDREG